MLALDVSRSMLAEDFTIGGERANRLEAVKQVTQKFIEAGRTIASASSAFAGRPYLVSPLTLDHDWLLQNLERVRIGLVEDGTAIGSAIASAANRLKDKDSKSRIVVLLTDGDNNAGKVRPAHRGGGREGARNQGLHDRRRDARLRADAGDVQDRCAVGRADQVYRNVKVEVDEETLKKIAEIDGRRSFTARRTRRRWSGDFRADRQAGEIDGRAESRTSNTAICFRGSGGAGFGAARAAGRCWRKPSGRRLP